MGSSPTRRNVTAVLAALEPLLGDQGVKLDRGAALAAAGEVYTADGVLLGKLNERNSGERPTQLCIGANPGEALEFFLVVFSGGGKSQSA